MSRRPMLFVLLAALVVVFLVLGPRVGDALYDGLLRLHGHRPHAETSHHGDEDGDGWPATPAGIMARDWVAAFAAGRGAMESFLRDSLSDASLARRPMPERLDQVEELHARLGALVLVSIEESEPHRLVAELLAEDGERHRFEFELEPEPPHALVRISMLHPGGGHGGHGQTH